jgi:DNA-binding CsgD family transcriptional regulator
VARKQPTRPYDVPPDDGDGGPDRHTAGSDLTPAEEHAMRRSAPLTPAQFEELRRLAAGEVDQRRRA